MTALKTKSATPSPNRSVGSREETARSFDDMWGRRMQNSAAGWMPGRKARFQDSEERQNAGRLGTVPNSTRDSKKRSPHATLSLREGNLGPTEQKMLQLKACTGHSLPCILYFPPNGYAITCCSPEFTGCWPWLFTNINYNSQPQPLLKP